MREASVTRNTAETEIQARLCLDGMGKSEIDTGIGFLDHMLTLFAAHGRFDLTVRCRGDLQVDGHHSTEDIGIVLGEALGEALGDKRGVTRYGSMLLPMDETLILCAVDLSGRSCLRSDIVFPTERIGTFDTELFEEFFLALVRKAELTLHFKMLDGANAHHIAEGAFKAFGRALQQAVTIDPALAGEIPSTKGRL